MQHAYPSHVCACLVSTYPPRQCGIATFTAALCQALSQGQNNIPPGVMALTNTASEYQYPPEVVFEIRQNQLDGMSSPVVYGTRACQSFLSP
jgi:hypothetical protein